MSPKQVVNKTAFEILQLLKEDGLLAPLMSKGIIPIDVPEHINTYSTYLDFIKKGLTKMEAYKSTAAVHSVHWQTVIYIKKKMES